MAPNPSRAEIALSTRVAEFERKLAQQGNLTVWSYITSVLPAPVLVLAGAAFLSFHAWEYYNKGQQDAAKTKIAKAESVLAALQAITANMKIGDLPAQTAKLKADLAKAQVDFVNKKAQAESMRAAADAALNTSGLYTLEERAARAKLIESELTAAGERGEAELTSGMISADGKLDASRVGQLRRWMRGFCNGNRYAELAGCPANLITVRDSTAQALMPSSPDAGPQTSNVAPNSGAIRHAVTASIGSSNIGLEAGNRPSAGPSPGGGWLGVQLKSADAQNAQRLGMTKPRGIMIVWLAENGPSLAAGLQSGDIIVKFNGSAANDAAKLMDQIRANAPGTAIQLALLREGQEVEKTIQLAERPQELDNGFTVNTERLQMRSCPDASAKCPAVGIMSRGTHVGILGDAANGWVKGYFPGEDGKPVEGFVSKKFLQ